MASKCSNSVNILAINMCIMLAKPADMEKVYFVHKHIFRAAKYPQNWIVPKQTKNAQICNFPQFLGYFLTKIDSMFIVMKIVDLMGVN